MSNSKVRSAIHLEPELHRALRVKAELTQRSVSDLVNDAVKDALLEDREDIAAFKRRDGEPHLTYEQLVDDLKAHGKA